MTIPALATTLLLLSAVVCAGADWPTVVQRVSPSIVRVDGRGARA